MELSSRLLDNTSSRPQLRRLGYSTCSQTALGTNERTNERAMLPFSFHAASLDVCLPPVQGCWRGIGFPVREVNK